MPLKFACEFESQRKLPFLDVLVHEEENDFLTSIYHKPTFTGLYHRCDSFSPKRQKGTSLIKCLIDQTQKISSEKFLGKDLANLK